MRMTENKEQKSNSIAIIASLLVVIFFAAIFPACSSRASNSDTVSLTEMAFATSIDGLNRPLDKKSYFPAATPKIYCCVKVSNAPLDTEITADWIYIKGDDPTQENYLMDRKSAKVDGTRFVAFSFAYNRPDILWIRGEYKVILSVNGVPKVQGPFVIQ
jgi:hypothetical protein